MAIEILCHFDGVDGSTTLVDETGNIPSFTVYSPSALSTTGHTFGSACLAVSGGFVQFSNATFTGVFFATNDLTIRFRYTPHANDLSGTRYLVDIGNISLSLSSGVLSVRVFFADSTDDSVVIGSLSAGTPYAISVERFGNTYNIFLDGTRISQIVSTKSASEPSYNSIGSYGDPTYSVYGKIDELLVDNGVSYAQNATSYTVETVAFNLLGIATIEHQLFCPLLPDVTTQTIEHSLPCPIFTQRNIEQLLSCPIVSLSAIEHQLFCPLNANVSIEHLLKINDVFHSEHALSVGSWSVSYIEHSLPVLMTTIALIEQQLNCPIDTINPTTHLEHVLIIPMLNSNSIVINTHSPETPLHGTYS